MHGLITLQKLNRDAAEAAAIMARFAEQDRQAQAQPVQMPAKPVTPNEH